MADLVNDPHWAVLFNALQNRPQLSEPFDSLSSCFGIVCLRFTASRHAESLFLCLHFDVTLIPISDKVALRSFDAGIYSASLQGKKMDRTFYQSRPQTALFACAENPRGFSPVCVCVVFWVSLSSGLREAPQRQKRCALFQTLSMQDSSAPIFSVLNRPLLSACIFVSKNQIPDCYQVSKLQDEVSWSDYLKVTALTQRKQAWDAPSYMCNCPALFLQVSTQKS